MAIALLTLALVMITAFYAYETRLMRLAMTEPALILATEFVEDSEQTTPTVINVGSYGAVILDASMKKNASSNAYRLALVPQSRSGVVGLRPPLSLGAGASAWLVWGEGDQEDALEPGVYSVEVVFAYGPPAWLYALRAAIEVDYAPNLITKLRGQELRKLGRFDSWRGG